MKFVEGTFNTVKVLFHEQQRDLGSDFLENFLIYAKNLTFERNQYLKRSYMSYLFKPFNRMANQHWNTFKQYLLLICPISFGAYFSIKYTLTCQCIMGALALRRELYAYLKIRSNINFYQYTSQYNEYV